MAPKHSLSEVRSIAIIGLGLIGGSLGLALKEAGLNRAERVGYARNPAVAARAAALGAVDRTGDSIAAAVDGADVAILATPTLAMPEIMQQMAPHLKAGCIVTDTASTKGKVMEWAESYLPSTVGFVGGHPMAGKEQSGIDVAEAGLFRGCAYCLVPGHGASQAPTDLMAEMVGKLGATPLLLTAAKHDQFVAGISHLPFILSSSLVLATARSPLWKDMSRLAASGYRDVGRLASGNARMNRDICLTNRENILLWIDEFTAELARFRRLVSEGGQELEEAFLAARQARQAWLDDYGKRS
ncbi:MAG: prephenate dehydrogenase [Chloroflexi bacterium]|nr:prephenate dehydrogenase [Chloroflexota bacterium]